MTATEPRTTVGVPEVGQLVRARDRHWVVSDVVASTLSEEDRCQHLVELAIALTESLTNVAGRRWT